MPLIDFFGGGQQKGDSTTGASYVKLLDSIGNGIAKLQRAFIPSTQEFLMVAGKNDSFATAIRTDRKGNIINGNYTPEIIEPFEGATVNVQKWNPTSTTFVPAQTTIGGYAHNPTNITTAAAGTMLVSQRLMYKFPRMPLQIKRRFRHSLVAGSVTDFGFGLPSTLTTLIVPNGAQLRITTSGTIVAYITFNGAEIATGVVLAKSTLGGNTIDQPLTMVALVNNYYVYDVIIDDDNVVFTIQDGETGNMLGLVSLPVPAAVLKMFGSTGLPYYERTYNTGTPTAAPVVVTGELQCLSTDMNVQLDAAQLAAILGMSGDRHPFTGAQLGNHTNSIGPVSATLSNIAGGYATTIKDGKWQFAAVAGAVTDYCLFGWQVPVGSRFIVDGVRISTRNTGAAVAGTPSTLEWAISINGSAVSLATANILRTQLDSQSFAVGAAIEAPAPTIDVDFKVGQVCESGRFICLILTLPVGTATASQIIRGAYTLKGRFI